MRPVGQGTEWALKGAKALFSFRINVTAASGDRRNEDMMVILSGQWRWRACGGFSSDTAPHIFGWNFIVRKRRQKDKNRAIDPLDANRSFSVSRNIAVCIWRSHISHHWQTRTPVFGLVDTDQFPVLIVRRLLFSRLNIDITWQENDKVGILGFCFDNWLDWSGRSH